jgi:hypothetical protein
MRVSLSVFVSIFADSKFKDLNESKFSNMIEKIKLQLIIWYTLIDKYSIAQGSQHR